MVSQHKSLNTSITELLEIELPIIQGGMAWVSRAEMVAAVSEAGGLGILGAGSLHAHELRDDILKVKSLTSKPFGVNLPLFSVNPACETDVVQQNLKVILEEKVHVVFTAAGPPSRFTNILKEAGCVVIHVVPSPRLAQKAQDAGVDAVVAECVEAGGHLANDPLPGSVLWPTVKKQMHIPVIAAGGIATGAHIAAALAMGADAVQMGTRFIATKECNANDVFKMLITDAPPDASQVYCRPYHPARALMSPVIRRLQEMEREGKSVDELREFRGTGRSQKGSLEGNVDEGIFPCGTGAGVIEKVLPVSELMQELTRDCLLAMSRGY
ncbi:MAG: nitronate monooxygenase [Deltaproteobacteria bacterium]|nr:nitronate monooxygenase [Deltaproteobacteria bacterium]